MRNRKKIARRRAAAALLLLTAAGLWFSFQRFKDILQSQRLAAKTPPGAVIGRWTFSGPGSLDAWEEKIFKGKTSFKPLSDEGGILRIESRDACSGLFVKVKTDAKEGVFLEWRWRAREFPKKKKHVLSLRSEDDFAARVYVIFEAANLFRSDVIEYVWDESLPVGDSQESPFSDRIQLVVLQSGPAGEGEAGWRQERRDVTADYRKLFGREPKNTVGRIAIMTDSDSTGTAASADYGTLVLAKKL